MTTTVFGQDINVKHDLFSFKAKSDYKVTERSEERVVLSRTAVIDSLPIDVEISIRKLSWNPEKNGVKDVSDIAKLGEIAMVGEWLEEVESISGINEIGKYQTYYTLSKTMFFQVQERSN
ncbi:MAG: hypothetical protein ACK5IQ_02785 [Bacteroidales bacterium]